MPTCMWFGASRMIDGAWQRQEAPGGAERSNSSPNCFGLGRSNCRGHSGGRPLLGRIAKAD